MGFQIRKLHDSPLWSITAGYFSPKLNSAARSVPGMRFDPEIKAHVGYIDAIEQVGLRLAEMGLNAPSTPENTRKWTHNLPVSYDGAREYQREGIDFLVNQAGSGALLADEMGCGKSAQAVKAVRAFRRKTIIVCPSHVRGVWERPPNEDDKGGELAKWWPKARVFTPYGITPEPIPEKTDITVIHYDIVYAWVDVLLEWAAGSLTVVFDEAQALLNAESRRSTACRELAAAAQGRIALTGTPPVDRVSDLHNIVSTISPGRFGDWYPYAMRYCDPTKKEVPGPEKTTKTVTTFEGRSNTDELRKRLDWFVLRRTKREVLKELPALQRQIIDVDVPPKHRISINARIVGDRRQMRTALNAAADGKFKSVIALVKEHLETGQRVVLATYRREICEKFSDQLGETATTNFIHGGIPLKRRQKVIDDLRRVEGACCLVANIDCISTGIDLTFASVGVVSELVYEPQKLLQLEARTHRYGQSLPVIWQYVIARGTGDELILRAVIGKLDNFLDLVETDTGDGFKETLDGKRDEGLSRLAATLKKMGSKKMSERQGYKRA